MPAPSSAVTGIPGRYATALFELAQERNVLDAVAGDLASLRQLIGESDDLRRLVRSPLYGREAQARAMQAVLEQGGAHDLTRRFVGMLTHNRRLFTLSDVARAYAQLLAQHRGEMVAYVTSAHALEDAQLDAIRAEVAAATKATIRVELPAGFQTSEFLLQHGFVDRIVPRSRLKSEIARAIDYCGK